MFGSANLPTIFITGLLTGGLACIAVQGGLLTAALAYREEEKLKSHVKEGKVLPIVSFLFAKLFIYTLFGFFLGWLGSLLQLSLQVRVIIQFVVVIFMLGTALNLLHTHRLFRYFAIQPPNILTRLIRKQSKRQDIFTPAILGLLTVFIPCGTTQAMMALAVASGQPLVGAAILFVFVLGTSPLFFLIGYATMRLGDVFKRQFSRVAAIAIILLALFNLDAALALTGTEYTLSNLLQGGSCIITYCPQQLQPDPITQGTIIITPVGYSPNYLVVKSGSKVTLHLVNNNASGCLQAFTVPSLNLQKIVLPNTSGDFTFTAPTNPGRIAFMCSAGLHPGVIQVI